MKHAKRIQLLHGVVPEDMNSARPSYRSSAELVRPYTHKLVAPVDGHRSIEIRVLTLAVALEAIREARDKFQPGTQPYQDEMFHAMLRECTTPVLTPELLDEMAGVDVDEIRHIMNRGTHASGARAGKPAFELRTDAETLKEVTLLLHTNADRREAEGLSTVDRSEDPIQYEARLAHRVTMFGPNADKRPDWRYFLHFTWPDFQRVTAEVYARDYEPLADVLTGNVEVAGKATPFPDVPSEAHSNGEDAGGVGDAESG